MIKRKAFLAAICLFASASEAYASWPFTCSEIGYIQLPSIDAGASFNNTSPLGCNSNNLVISGELTNSSLFSNLSNLKVATGGSLNNSIGATFSNIGDSFDNYGTFLNSGVYDHSTYLPFNNYATIINTGTWNDYAGFSNPSINNTSTGSIVNNGSMNLSRANYNTGTITNNGNINLADGYGGGYAGSIQGAGVI